jgi:hypothetical protein
MTSLEIKDIKNNILTAYENNGYIKSYEKYNFANNLIKSITNATNIYDLLIVFKNHSTLVANHLAPVDCLNGCDSNDSPLSLFITFLLKKENIEFYKQYINSIKTNEDYFLNEWILKELNILLFTNPVEYKEQTFIFIKNDITGKRFNFWGGCWITSCYYSQNNIELKDVDETYLSFLELYKSLYRDESHINYNYYIRKVKEDLKFRGLTNIELPNLFLNFFNVFSLSFKKRKPDSSVIEPEF